MKKDPNNSDTEVQSFKTKILDAEKEVVCYHKECSGNTSDTEYCNNFQRKIVILANRVWRSGRKLKDLNKFQQAAANKLSTCIDVLFDNSK